MKNIFAIVLISLVLFALFTSCDAVNFDKTRATKNKAILNRKEMMQCRESCKSLDGREGNECIQQCISADCFTETREIAENERDLKFKECVAKSHQTTVN